MQTDKGISDSVRWVFDRAELTSSDVLGNETPAGGVSDESAFAREGYAVGRGVFAAEALRELRAPLVEALVADGRVRGGRG